MRPLPYWGTGTPKQWERIREAKDNLKLGFLVKPVRTDGTYWRVMAFGEPPEYISDYALVRPETTVEGYEKAIRWLYGEDILGPYRTETMLEQALGCPKGSVREVGKTQLRREWLDKTPFSHAFALGDRDTHTPLTDKKAAEILREMEDA